MPNWVKTEITFCNVSDSEFADIVSKYGSDNGPIDFEKIIPMPENIFRGNLTHEDRFVKYRDNNWYDWSCDNWGTKWNARWPEADYFNHTIMFDTAWSFPSPVIDKLAELTGREIIAQYADEDFGYNVGQVHYYEDGQIEEAEIAEDSDEAWEIVTHLWGETRESIQDNE